MITIPKKDSEEKLLSEISGERIKSKVTTLSKREMRVTGSENERLTAESIAEELRSLGLETAIEEYETKSWEHSPAKLTVSDGSETEIDVHFMPFSPPVKGGAAKGKLVPLKFGFPKEITAIGDEQSIVFEDWNQAAGVHYQILSAARSGKNIAALGMIGEVSGGFRIDGVPMLAKPVPFPVFSIKREDGLLLRSICAKKSFTAKLDGKSKIVPGATSANVTALKKGSGRHDARILISAHHDGWFAGANDNLSGVCSMLEAARILCDQENERSIEFASFGSEEFGAPGFQYYLWGSRQYVKRHEDNIGRIACVLNCELAGLSNSEHLLVDCTPDLVSYFETIFDDTTKRCSYPKKFEMSASVPTSCQADQLNFQVAGVPSALLYWSWFDEYHTDLDTADKLVPDKLKLFAELLLMSAIRMANAQLLPLSLTRYARILRAGHTVVSSHLSIELGRISTPGIEQVKRLAGKILDLEEALATVESFSRAAGSFERQLKSADEKNYVELNDRLLRACSMLNKALCRTGGILGEDAMFPGYLQYSEELRKVDEALESLKRVKGSDMQPEIKAELVPVFVPEVGTELLDFSKELALLASKRGALVNALQKEIARITGSIREAEGIIR